MAIIRGTVQKTWALGPKHAACVLRVDRYDTSTQSLAEAHRPNDSGLTDVIFEYPSRLNIAPQQEVCVFGSRGVNPHGIVRLEVDAISSPLPDLRSEGFQKFQGLNPIQHREFQDFLTRHEPSVIQLEEEDLKELLRADSLTPEKYLDRMVQDLKSIERYGPILSLAINDYYPDLANHLWAALNSAEMTYATTSVSPMDLILNNQSVPFAEMHAALQSSSQYISEDTQAQAYVDRFRRYAESSGHTGFMFGNVMQGSEDYNFSQPAMRRALQAEANYRLSFMKTLPNNNTFYMARSIAYDTRLIADRMAQLQSRAPEFSVDFNQYALPEFLNEGQTAGVKTLVNSNVGVLTGGAGVGKTTVLKEAIAAVRSAKGDLSVKLLAPTGKAATRMAESTQLPAMTIHRMLELLDEDRTSDNYYLNTDLVVVDEASMVDEHLMARLVERLPATARLWMVGDPNQLPSVGYGQVLSDLLAQPEIPVAQLTQVMRQQSIDGETPRQNEIVGLSQRILEQEGTEDLNLAQYQNEVRWVNMRGAPTDEELEKNAANQVHGIVNHLMEKGVSPNDIQILSPTHKGYVGTAHMNVRMMNVMNQHKNRDKLKLARFNRVFRIGDRVMFQRNDSEDTYANGDTGLVTYVDMKAQILHVSLDRHQGQSITSPPVLVESHQLDVLAHSFCKTIHKSQGSEYPYVIIPILPQHAHMATKESVYTAVTRAKTKLYLTGDQSAFSEAVANTSREKRFSGLRTLMTRAFDLTAKATHEANQALEAADAPLTKDREAKDQLLQQDAAAAPSKTGDRAPSGS